MEFKNKFKWLGYEEVKETKTYIEAFKYPVSERKYMYDRIKINKKTLEVNKDSRSGQGNRGHRNLTYDEVMLVAMILKHYKEVQSNES